MALRLTGVIAALPWPILLVVVGNHLVSPDITRGVVYETVYRLLHGQDIYPSPSGAFVSLDYNPLVYYLDAAAALLFGLNPATLRLVAAVGSLGAAFLVYLAVRRSTGSPFCGLLATGLYAAAYRAFDCYLDYPQPDTWMLLAALLGLFLLQDEERSGRIALGVALLSAAFWFKQQGALLAIGGVLYVTWRLGARRAAPYWMLAALLGPFAYFALGPHLFGAKFLYYTWQVPHAYSQFRLRGLLHAGWYFGRFWAIPLALALGGLFDRLRRRVTLDVWGFTLPFACLIGLLGSMDFSEHNVYIPAATWLIVVGVSALPRAADLMARLPPARQARAGAGLLAAVVLAFAATAYDPREVLVPRGAWSDYHALVAQVRGLGGQVYMPGVGQLPGDLRLPVPVHWVPLEDLVRGREHHTSGDPLLREVLKDVLAPAGEAFIVADRPLDEDTLLSFLAPDYELVEDMGDRYASLRALPGWYSGRTWPRYLYRYRAPAP
jgi:4-amino-4-deoxy-L-arabinose transferase-like glycosyltransferase